MVTIISGTNREGSRSLHVARLLEQAYAALGVPATLLDLRTLPPELFTPAAYADDIPAFESGFAAPILASPGVHIVVPEYNGSFPGVLKYFIDMLPYPEAFEGRIVAFTGISSGRSGAVRPVEQLQMVFAYRNAYTYPGRVFIPMASSAINSDGFLTDTALSARLSKQASGFADFIRKLER